MKGLPQGFRPLLAGQVEKLEDIPLPTMGSPKYDGIRAIVVGGKLLSRKLLPIPNKALQKKLGIALLNGFDGELLFGPATNPDVYNVTQSAVMAVDGPWNVHFYVFDDWSIDAPYEERMENVRKRIRKLPKSLGLRLFVLEASAVMLHKLEDMKMYDEACCDVGFEGTMYRSPDGEYKYGRSTKNEAILLKYKVFADSDAVILDAYPEMKNENVMERSRVGSAKRSSAKAGKVQKDTLGGLAVRDVHSGVEFNVGHGWNDALAKELWETHKAGKLKGKFIVYRFQKAGMKDKPRFPRFKGLRDERDIINEGKACATNRKISQSRTSAPRKRKAGAA